MFDITNYVTNMYWGNDGEEWQTFFTNSEDWNDSTVDDIMETPVWRGRQNVDPLYTYNTTFHALEKLAVTRAHRAVVLNQDTNRVVNIMTQSMLISEIKQRIFMLPNGLRNKLVRNMTEFFTTCKTINENDKVLISLSFFFVLSYYLLFFVYKCIYACIILGYECIHPNERF